MLHKEPTDFEKAQVNFLELFNLQLWPPEYSITPHKETIDVQMVDAWMSQRNSEGIWVLHDAGKRNSES
jgi:hypothetical protein